MNEKNVIVYSTPTCPYCTMAKNYLRQNKINFTEIDVSKDHSAAMDMMRLSGSQGVPQIRIGDKIILGFNKDAIDAELVHQ